MRPGVVNETWLKDSIINNEIIEDKQYSIFRKDRSPISHPIDPLNPSKYRRNGGGVLIAVRSDINTTAKEIKLINGSEMLAIELTLHDKTKLIFCTCYRVGTQGISNHNIINESLKSLFIRRGCSKVFVIGDFNLSSVSWPLDDNFSMNNRLKQHFIDTFSDLGLAQCITHSTHIKGNTLDLLLTNSVSHVQNINVLEHNSICRSDHFPIKFELNSKVKRKKATKRKCYNFKHANWDALNFELFHTQ